MPFPDIQLLTTALIGQVTEQARRSPRLRMNYNFHAGPADNPHRFLNVFLQGSYVAPHRHSKPPKAEAFIVLEGYVAIFCFDETGTVTSRQLAGSGPLPQPLPAALRGLEPVRGVDIAPGVWHTIAAVTPEAACYEVKPGPWDPTADKEFAAWAPAEGDPGAPVYLNSLFEKA